MQEGGLMQEHGESVTVLSSVEDRVGESARCVGCKCVPSVGGSGTPAKEMFRSCLPVATKRAGPKSAGAPVGVVRHRVRGAGRGYRTGTGAVGECRYGGPSISVLPR